MAGQQRRQPSVCLPLLLLLTICLVSSARARSSPFGWGASLAEGQPGSVAARRAQTPEKPGGKVLP